MTRAKPHQPQASLHRCWPLSQSLECAGGAIRWDAFGEGLPLVLVHGTPSSSYLWRKVADVLAESRRVYLFDLLGYGSSEKHDGQDVTLAAQTKILIELLEHWELEAPDIAGHDFGGAITLRAHLLEGREFKRIALLDPVALGPWGSAFFTLVRANVPVFEQLPAAIHAAVVRAYLRGAFHSQLADNALDRYVAPWLGKEGQDAFYRQIAQADQKFTDEFEALLGAVRAPVLIVWGSEDVWIPPAVGTRLTKLIPSSRLELIRGAGHFLQEDAPEDVARCLARFFTAE